jgi:hypothetical protein
MPAASWDAGLARGRIGVGPTAGCISDLTGKGRCGIDGVLWCCFSQVHRRMRALQGRPDNRGRWRSPTRAITD